jgi:hypothetical protein
VYAVGSSASAKVAIFARAKPADARREKSGFGRARNYLAIIHFVCALQWLNPQV